MDSETDEGNRKRELENKIENREFLTFNEMREYNELVRKKNVNIFKMLTNTGWAWTNKDALFAMFNYILNDNTITKSLVITLLEERDKLEKAMRILNQKIEATQHKTNDFEILTSEYDKVMKSLEVNRMRAYLDIMDKKALEKLGLGKEKEDENT
jgi:hypothetical protein